MKTIIKRISTTEEYQTFELDTDKIESIDDCKKILKFLCSRTLKPLRNGSTYNGFEEVEKYFK